MSIAIGPTIEYGLVNVLAAACYEPNDGDIGATAHNYSTAGLGQASIETESPAVKKFGESVIPYDQVQILAMFGELV